MIKRFFIPTNDRWLLSLLNPPLLWWFNWRYLVHLKDEALNTLGFSWRLSRSGMRQILN
jgi:hypothetical protein